MDTADPTFILMGKLVLAAILGMILGTERAILARRPAGMRTFALVAMGSCLFVAVGAIVEREYLGLVNFDPMRIAAAVVQGVGFIGAGLIIFRGEAVHGVTTAAGLWLASAIGVAVAFGMYPVAIFAAMVTMLILGGVWVIETKLKEKLGIPLPQDQRDGEEAR